MIKDIPHTSGGFEHRPQCPEVQTVPCAKTFGYSLDVGVVVATGCAAGVNHNGEQLVLVRTLKHKHKANSSNTRDTISAIGCSTCFFVATQEIHSDGTAFCNSKCDQHNPVWNPKCCLCSLYSSCEASDGYETSIRVSPSNQREITSQLEIKKISFTGTDRA